MKTCYLAGPMRGRGKKTVARRFEKCAEQLRRRGWNVLVPKLEEEEGPEGRRRTVHHDVGLILQLREENDDAIVMMPGYDLSTGASGELGVSKWLNLRTLLFEEALEEEEDDEIVR